jgi:hypothetical protein
MTDVEAVAGNERIALSLVGAGGWKNFQSWMFSRVTESVWSESPNACFNTSLLQVLGIAGEIFQLQVTPTLFHDYVQLRSLTSKRNCELLQAHKSV